MKRYDLTPDQEKAFASLVRALRKCKDARIYLWDNYGHISAVNGKVVDRVVTNPDGRSGEPLDDAQVSTVDIRLLRGLWFGSNADDALFVER